MYRSTINPVRSTKVDWLVDDHVANVADDGPRALITAVASAAKRNKYQLLAWVVICTGLAAINALTILPSYTATASLVLESRVSTAGPISVSPAAMSLDAHQAETELQVIKSERLLTYVFESLDLERHSDFAFQSPGMFSRVRGYIQAALSDEPARPPTADERRQIAFANFAARVDVRRIGQSYVVDVSFTSSDRELAPRVANAIASAYLWQSLASKADKARNGAEFVQGRLNALSAQVSAAAAAVSAGTLPTTAVPDAESRVIGAAVQPLGPSAPRRGLIIALGVIIGLTTGFIILIVSQVFDRRIRTREALIHATGLPCFAIIPKVRRWKGVSRLSEKDMCSLASLYPEGGFAASIRDIRTSIMLARSSRQSFDNDVVALVSWTRDAGCTLICANLAHIIRESGAKVTIVDADIRQKGWSLADQTPQAAINTPCTLADALTSDARVNESDLLEFDGIALLPGRSSNSRVNQLAYLSSPKMPQIFDMARNRSEVLLDLPPLCIGADARAAAQYADAVVLVAAAGSTTSDELAAAVQTLKSAGANVIGAVLNRAGA